DPFLLEQQGLVAGEWLRDLKSRVWMDQGDHAVLATRRMGEQVWDEAVTDPVALYDAIRGPQSCASIGYVTDVGWTAMNVARMEAFFPGLTLLCTECTFLAADED